MPPTAILEHVMPGRLRVRVLDQRGETSYFRSALQAFSEHLEIASVTANPMTASILIEHTTDLASVRKIAAERGLFEIRESASPPSRNGDRSITPPAAALGIIGLSVYQAAQGRVLGPASENFWNAYGALRVLNDPLVALVFGSLGVLQLARGRLLGAASSLLFYALILERTSAVATAGRGRPRASQSPTVSK